MSYLEIILPFGIPPAALAKELVKQMKTPALAEILGYGRQSQILNFDEFSRRLPHEYWLSEPFCLETRMDAACLVLNDTCVNSAAVSYDRMQNYNLAPESGYWFILNPVHIHVARDHLVLTDQRRLAMSTEESQALFTAAQSMCEELEKTLLYGDAKTWFLRADDWQTLQTASLDAASGHNMDIWIAKGEKAVAWRKLQNEIQMLWHIHPVNQAREERGERTINSVWLHSGSTQASAATPVIFADENFDKTLASITTQRNPTRLCIDQLIEPALNSDWGTWLVNYQALDSDFLTPLLQALNSRTLTQIRLVVSDAQRLATFETKGKSWQFWRKPTIQPLFTLSQQT